MRSRNNVAVDPKSSGDESVICSVPSAAAEGGLGLGEARTIVTDLRAHRALRLSRSLTSHSPSKRGSGGEERASAMVEGSSVVSGVATWPRRKIGRQRPRPKQNRGDIVPATDTNGRPRSFAPAAQGRSIISVGDECSFVSYRRSPRRPWSPGAAKHCRDSKGERLPRAR